MWSGRDDKPATSSPPSFTFLPGWLRCHYHYHYHNHYWLIEVSEPLPLPQPLSLLADWGAKDISRCGYAPSYHTGFFFTGVSWTIYVNVDSPNLGFPYFNFLGGYKWKNHPVSIISVVFVSLFRASWVILSGVALIICCGNLKQLWWHSSIQTSVLNFLFKVVLNTLALRHWNIEQVVVRTYTGAW